MQPSKTLKTLRSCVPNKGNIKDALTTAAATLGNKLVGAETTKTP